MIGVEINFITLEGITIDNELFLDNDKARPNKFELKSWLKSGNSLRMNVNEYLPEGDDGYSFNLGLREYSIKSYEELEKFNDEDYKIF